MPAKDRIAPAALGTPEVEYLSGVRLALHDLDGRTRRELLASARQNLAERPATSSLDELTGQLGEPAEYAAGLRADAETAQPGRLAGSRRRHRIRLWSTWGVVLVVLAAIAFGVRWWVVWDPGFVQDSWRICAGADGAECDQTGFVSSDVTDVTQVPCTGTLNLTVEVLAGSTVAITSATIPGIHAPGDPGLEDPTYGPLILLDGVQAWKRPRPEELATPSTFPATTGPSPDATELHFRLDLCPKPLLVSPGGTQFIERIQLDYHALGRDRTAIVPLRERIAVTVPARG